jgi:hypothetical protein
MCRCFLFGALGDPAGVRKTAGGLGLIFELPGEISELQRVRGVSLVQVSAEALEVETGVQAEIVSGVTCPEEDELLAL